MSDLDPVGWTVQLGVLTDANAVNGVCDELAHAQDEITRLRAELAALRAPVGDAVVEAAARAIAWRTLTPHGRATCIWPSDFSDAECAEFRDTACAVLAIIVPMVRAEDAP